MAKRESGFLGTQHYTKGTHKEVSPGAVTGQTIHWAYAPDRHWERCRVMVQAPYSTHLFNFEVTLPGMGPMLILDPYGDEILPRRMRRAILSEGKTSETIGILHKTGEILRVAFIRERITSLGCPEEDAPGDTRDDFSMCFWRFPGTPMVPESYLKRIPELKTKKRPFFLSLTETSVYSFMERWSSYGDLASSLVIDLDFNERRLQVWGKSYREVSGWQG